MKPHFDFYRNRGWRELKLGAIVHFDRVTVLDDEHPGQEYEGHVSLVVAFLRWRVSVGLWW